MSTCHTIFHNYYEFFFFLENDRLKNETSEVSEAINTLSKSSVSLIVMEEISVSVYGDAFFSYGSCQCYKIKSSRITVTSESRGVQGRWTYNRCQVV